MKLLEIIGAIEFAAVIGIGTYFLLQTFFHNRKSTTKKKDFSNV